MSNFDVIREADQSFVAGTYGRFPVAIEKGKNATCYDFDGKEYIDFSSGIGVNSLGFCDEGWINAVTAQLNTLQHISNLYYTKPCIDAAGMLCERTGMKKVFFSNSGAEANECAIKAARKYAYLKDGCTDHEIIALDHSFHGRTMGALAVTGKKAYREAFEPLIGNVHFANMNDFDSVLAQVNDKTCAIIMETVQGEGGIYPATEEFMQKVKALCEEKDILLILDEIQCGMGRTGSMFAWQKYGIKPDIMTTAKALGCGVPVGAFMMTEKVGQSSLVAGDHGTTYGGNPLATAAINVVLDLFEENHIIDNVNSVGFYLEKKLDELVEKYDFIKTRRGVGFMQGLVFDKPVGPVISKALEKGLILINAGTDIIRFVPPLVITKEHVDEMITILTSCLNEG